MRLEITEHGQPEPIATLGLNEAGEAVLDPGSKVIQERFWDRQLWVDPGWAKENNIKTNGNVVLPANGEDYLRALAAYGVGGYCEATLVEDEPEPATAAT